MSGGHENGVPRKDGTVSDPGANADGDPTVVRFRVLGPLTVYGVRGQPVALGGPKPKRLLTTLLLAGAGGLGVPALIRAVWSDAPPPSSVANLHSYVSELRRRLPATTDGRQRIERGQGSYRIVLGDGELDADVFERLLDEARRAFDLADHGAAAGKIEAALRLWHAPLPDAMDPAVDELGGRWLRLVERRWTAIEDLHRARLALGQHRQLVGELRVDQGTAAAGAVLGTAHAGP
jgi:DNA-binding SARP family transcriptional activator